jgi:hypothetical protein
MKSSTKTPKFYIDYKGGYDTAISFKVAVRKADARAAAVGHATVRTAILDGYRLVYAASASR